MKYLLCLSFLILIVVAFSSCDDQMKGVMEPVVEEIMEETPAEPEMPMTEPEMPAEIPTDRLCQLTAHRVRRVGTRYISDECHEFSQRFRRF